MSFHIKWSSGATARNFMWKRHMKLAHVEKNVKKTGHFGANYLVNPHKSEKWPKKSCCFLTFSRLRSAINVLFFHHFFSPLKSVWNFIETPFLKSRIFWQKVEKKPTQFLRPVQKCLKFHRDALGKIALFCCFFITVFCPFFHFLTTFWKFHMSFPYFFETCHFEVPKKPPFWPTTGTFNRFSALNTNRI